MADQQGESNGAYDFEERRNRDLNHDLTFLMLLQIAFGELMFFNMGNGIPMLETETKVRFANLILYQLRKCFRIFLPSGILLPIFKLKLLFSASF